MDLLNEIKTLIAEEFGQKIQELSAQLESKIRQIMPRDGRDGRDGVDGQSPSQSQIEAIIRPLIPKPVKGKDGKDGKPGRDGLDGQDGLPGQNGKDAVIDLESLAQELLPLILPQLPQVKPQELRGITGARSRNPSSVTVSGTKNGTNKVFTLAKQSFSTAGLFLYVNGKKQLINTDFTLAGVTITFTIAPQSTDDIEAIIFN